MRTIVFDNEAIQALTNSTHPKHRTVGVEADWDRTTPGADAINHFRLRDHVLDTPAANLAASIQRRCRLGPADVHIGATARSVASGDVVVLTSDPTNIAFACSPTTPKLARISRQPHGPARRTPRCQVSTHLTLTVTST